MSKPSNLRAKAVPQPVKNATTNQLNKLAQGEIAELRQSLRYAEHLLAQSQEERAALEGELARHDERVEEVREVVRGKENENRQIA